MARIQEDPPSGVSQRDFKMRGQWRVPAGTSTRTEGFNARMNALRPGWWKITDGKREWVITAGELEHISVRLLQIVKGAVFLGDEHPLGLATTTADVLGSALDWARDRAQRESQRRMPLLTVKIAALEVNPLSLTVLRNGTEVLCSSLEFRLLYLLASNANHVFSRARILEGIWGSGRSVTSRSVDVYIARLRRKIEEDPSHPTYLQSVRDEGYVFRAKVNGNRKGARGT